jgi:hypothetical protein
MLVDAFCARSSSDDATCWVLVLYSVRSFCSSAASVSWVSN